MADPTKLTAERFLALVEPDDDVRRQLAREDVSATERARHVLADTYHHVRKERQKEAFAELQLLERSATVPPAPFPSGASPTEIHSPSGTPTAGAEGAVPHDPEGPV